MELQCPSRGRGFLALALALAHGYNYSTIVQNNMIIVHVCKVRVRVQTLL